MMVPANRLLAVFSLSAVPCSLAWALLPVAAPFAVMILGGLLALALVDARLAGRSLRGVGAEMPEEITLTHGREGECTLVLTGGSTGKKEVRVGLELPEQIHSSWDDFRTILPEEGARRSVPWPVLPQRRGRFSVEKCHLQVRSFLGFWHWQEVRHLKSEIKVYPNLFPEKKRLAALFLNRGSLGLHLHRQVGKGREFEKLREYLPGDSLNDIHWRGTAKRGHLVTKQYQIERTQEIYVVIDSSRLNARDSGNGQSMLERYITAALMLNLVARQQGDLFGLAAFSDRVHQFVSARSGLEHFRTCQDALINLQAQSHNPDYGELAAFLSLRLRRRALILFLTCLDEPALAERFEKEMALVSRRHLLLVNMIKPSAATPLFSTDDVDSTECVCRHLAGHLVWQSLRELGRNLKMQGVDFHLLDEERLSTDLVSQYINVKRRQLL
jgi:uncharacterized protein (DUF58 family)